MFGRRKHQPPKKHPKPTVADECEAFLSGHIADLYEESDLSVPCWARLNRLAHGSLADLERLATDATAPSGRLADATWRYTLKRLATQLLADSHDPEVLRRRQAAVLWPLEDELIAAHDGPVRTPSELFRLVVTVLGEDTTPRTGTARDDR